MSHEVLKIKHLPPIHLLLLHLLLLKRSMLFAFAELKVWGALVFSLSTARMFFEMEQGHLGYHANFTNGVYEDGTQDGRLHYQGNCPAVFKVTVTGAHVSKSKGIYFGELRVNGEYASLPASLQRFHKAQRLPGYAYSEDTIHLETLAALDPGDYISFWASSSTGDPIEFRDVTIIAHQVSDFEDCDENSDAENVATSCAEEPEEELDMEIYVDISTAIY
jgi:hypothetical protein